MSRDKNTIWNNDPTWEDDPVGALKKYIQLVKTQKPRVDPFFVAYKAKVYQAYMKEQNNK